MKTFLLDLSRDATLWVVAVALAVALFAVPCVDRLDGAIGLLLDALGY